MMPFHQGLELGLYVGAAGVVLKPERLERAALGIENLAALGRGLCMAALAGAALAEQRERVVAGKAVAKIARRAASTLAADRAHLPGRPMAGHRVLLIFRDGIVAHAGKEVVRIVVFADVFEAELPIFVGALTAFRCTVRRRARASRPVAGRKLGAQPAVQIRFDANSIEQW